jgi:hypothetical protein
MKIPKPSSVSPQKQSASGWNPGRIDPSEETLDHCDCAAHSAWLAAEVHVLVAAGEGRVTV